MPEQQTDDAERRPDKPSEWTYKDYREVVEVAATVAVDALEEYPEENGSLHDAVDYAIEGDSRFLNYGHMLMTVLLSDQSPDQPDYCEPWHVHVSEPERWASAVQEMAYVCYYSDVYERAKREQADRDHPEHATTDADDCPTCLVEE